MNKNINRIGCEVANVFRLLYSSQFFTNLKPQNQVEGE